MSNKSKKEEIKKLVLEQIKQSGKIDEYLFYELKLDINLLNWYLKIRGLEDKPKKKYRIKNKPRNVSDKQQILRNQRESMKYIDRVQYKICKNAIFLNARNSDEHKDMKYMICKQLNIEGKEFLTEVFLKNGKRADILCLDTKTIYEVVASESEESKEEKRMSYYPEFFEITFIDANQVFYPDIIH